MLYYKMNKTQRKGGLVCMMKKYFILLTLFAAAVFSLKAAEQYDINFGNGVKNGSISINGSLDSFSMTTDFGSVGGSGAIGYYTYTDDINNYQLGDQTFTKKDGAITIDNLAEGQNIGFYLVKKNGQIYSDFYFGVDKHGLYMDFEKNYGNGKDERIYISSIEAVNSKKPTGQPLPGALMTLAVGGAAAWIARKRGFKLQKKC